MTTEAVFLLVVSVGICLSLWWRQELLGAVTAFFNRGVALNAGLDIIARNFIQEALANEEPDPVTSVQTPGGTVTVRRREAQ